jgi:hypothetical protein
LSNSDLHRHEIDIRVELDSLYQQEEILWKFKSRETWLTCKDLNTKYFHMSTLIKRHRNAIDFLKLPLGSWIFDCQLIGNAFCLHFGHLFTTSRTSETPDFLHLFESLISDEVNQDLCAIPSEQEIYEALFSIGATKAPGPDGFTGLFC